METGNFINLLCLENQKGVFMNVSIRDKLKKNPSIQLSSEELMNEFYSLNSKFDKLHTSISNLTGRFDLEQENREAMSEKLADFSSQIGELRSIVVSRERFYDQIESDFQDLKDQVAQISPDSIQSKFQEIDGWLVKQDAIVDKTTNRVGEIEDKLKRFDETIQKIRSFDNLFDTLQELNEKVRVFNDIKNDIERSSVKIESIYSDLNEKSRAIGTHEDRLSGAEKTLADISKSLDKINKSLKNTAPKKDVDTIKTSLDVVKKGILKKDLDAAVTKLSSSNSSKGSHVESLKMYIESMKKKGYPSSQIEKGLLEKGWPKNLVEKYLS